MKRRLLLILLSVSISGSVFAIVFGGSNLGMLGYPEHSCTKPIKPVKPYSFNSRWEVDSYSKQIEAYNSDRQRYVTCVNEYLENAGNDIKRIQEKMEETIEEAKMPSF